MSAIPTTRTQVGSRAVPAPHLVDPRALRVAAGLTTLLLAIVLLTASAWLLAAQAAVFAVAAVFGVRRSPYALLFSRFVRPRLAPPAEYEDDRPPRFAQAVGLLFSVIGLIGYLVGAPIAGAVATGLALAAAFLNAAFGFCLGCEIYLLLRRIAPTKQDNTTTEVTP
jgi:MFS family permease